MAFGTGNRPGRLAISPRDFARFGLLYLQDGRWKDQQLIRPDLVHLVVRTPLPLSIPRTSGDESEMIPEQRSIGGGNNQCDHQGSYSYAWWINGVRRNGERNWPDVPSDAFGCFGHGDIRAVVVIPSLSLVVSWNDTRIEGHEKVNDALRVLVSP
jgi:CubicO group peptidase (beta-lactamase class C family)